MTRLPRLMVVGEDVARVLAPAARQGALVQLRGPAAVADLQRVARAGLGAGIPRYRLLVNGRAEGAPGVAVRLGCGLHLPASVPTPRTTDERPRPWGRAVHGIDEALAAVGEKPDYLVAGTIFCTPSKPGRPAAGIDFLRELTKRVAPVPVFAIGGIDMRRARLAIAAGAHGVAVVRAVGDAKQPGAAAATLLAALDGAASRISG